MRVTPFLTLTFVAYFGTASASAQQQFETLGPNQCINCHDHDAEKQWYEKKEILEVQRLFPEMGKNAGHINSLNQLEGTKSDEYAKAVGLADKYDVNGSCVACHATVYRGDANAGVSCESCHGPGSGYLKPHIVKDSYEESVTKYGMTRLIGNLQGWTQQCTNCHVMNDQRLIEAKHPSGDDFEIGKKFQPVSLHFKKMYAEADVAAIGKAELDGIIRRRRGLPPAAAPVPAAPPVATTTTATPPAATPPPETPRAATGPTPSATAAPANAPPPQATSPTPTTAPRTPASRPTVQALNLTAPPAGSPTSIEPAAPLEIAAAAPTPAASSAPAVTDPPPDTIVVVATPSWVPWLIGGVVIVIAGGVLLWWRGKTTAN